MNGESEKLKLGDQQAEAKPRVLHLTLKKIYFDMVGNGKPEEYREINNFWARRLFFRIEVPWGGYLSPMKDLEENDFTFSRWLKFTGGAPIFNTWDIVLFANGGHFGNVPKKTFEFKGIEIREGREEWGAEPGKKYFVIKLGEPY